MSAVLVDTNVVSYILKRDTRAERFEHYRTDGPRYLSFMTVAELYQWAAVRRWGPQLRRRLDVILAGFIIVHSDERVCRFWADVRTGALRRGRAIDVDDAWIAGCALHLGVPLVTHNRRDFEMVPGLALLPDAP